MKKQNIRSMRTNNHGIAGIIVAVLILGLVISVISIIQTVYVPKWMEEREAEHMGVIADQFGQLKYSLDNIAVTQSITPVTTSFTLGSKELGFLSSARAFGHIQVYTEGWKLSINGPASVIEFNVLTYSSQNAYFLDQTYTYEAGASVLSQDDGSVMLYPPSISMSKTTNDITINWSCIDFNVLGSVESIGGYGSYPLRLQFRDNQTYIYQSVEYPINPSTISVETSHPDIWEAYLKKICTNAGLKVSPTPDYDVEITTTLVEDGLSIVKIDFTQFTGDPLNAVLLNIYKTNVNLQIGPGWIG
jgi:hypothetical protein